MKYFAKYLPVNEPLKNGDKALKPGFKEYPKEYIEEVDEFEDWSMYQKVVLFLCTTEIEVGDEVFGFIHGHCDEVEKGPFGHNVSWNYKDFVSGWPDEPHIVKDLNYSEYKPYRTQIDTGWSSPGRLVRVLGQISEKAVWISEGDYFNEEDIKRESKKYREFKEGKSEKDFDHFNLVSITNLVTRNIIKIKCPTCKIYH